MKILGPALAGAAMQLMAIGLLMVLFYFLASAGYFFLGWPFALCEDETACQAAAPLGTPFLFDHSCRHCSNKHPFLRSNKIVGTTCISHAASG